MESCAAIGREPIEFRIGTDALAVVVSQDNDFIVNATMEELAQIFTAEKWSDVKTEWPDEEIQRFIPGTDSGTFDFFVEEVFDEDKARSLSAANQQLSEDDNVLVQGSPCACVPVRVSQPRRFTPFLSTKLCRSSGLAPAATCSFGMAASGASLSRPRVCCATSRKPARSHAVPMALASAATSCLRVLNWSSEIPTETASKNAPWSWHCQHRLCYPPLRGCRQRWHPGLT